MPQHRLLPPPSCVSLLLLLSPRPPITAVIPPAGGVVKSFKIDPSTTTECEVADTLWELVEQAHSPAAVAAGSC